MSTLIVTDMHWKIRPILTEVTLTAYSLTVVTSVNSASLTDKADGHGRPNKLLAPFGLVCLSALARCTRVTGAYLKLILNSFEFTSTPCSNRICSHKGASRGASNKVLTCDGPVSHVSRFLTLYLGCGTVRSPTRETDKSYY